MTAPRPFRFGVVNERAWSPAALIRRAQTAEALGYATFLVRDHLLPDVFGNQLAPMLALTTVAATTTTIRVGTLVIANDFRHPALLAKEAATLDVLSGGRLELGLGAGWLRAEYDAAGLRFERPGTRIDRLEESIAVLKRLFADGPCDVVGEHYAVRGLDGYPKPVQRPHPPLLLGGGSRRILTLAGREADIVGVLTTSVATGAVVDEPSRRRTAAVAERVGWVRDGAGSRFPAIELSLVDTVVVTDDRRRQTERFIAECGWDGVAVEDVWDMPSVFIGTVDEIANDMRRRRDRLGFSYHVVADADLEALAPVVAILSGR